MRFCGKSSGRGSNSSLSGRVSNVGTCFVQILNWRSALSELQEKHFVLVDFWRLSLRREARASSSTIFRCWYVFSNRFKTASSNRRVFRTVLNESVIMRISDKLACSRSWIRFRREVNSVLTDEGQEQRVFVRGFVSWLCVSGEVIGRGLLRTSEGGWLGWLRLRCCARNLWMSGSSG